jgi:hypothetical protein
MDILSLVPSDDVAETNLIQSSEDGNGREDQRGKDGFPVCKHLNKGLVLQALLLAGSCARN